MDLRRAAASNLGRSRRNELLGLGVMFGAASSVLGIVLIKMPSFPLGLGFATSLTFLILSARQGPQGPGKSAPGGVDVRRDYQPKLALVRPMPVANVWRDE